MPLPDTILTQIADFLALGGPVVTILLTVSILSLSVILLKLYAFFQAGIGSHRCPQHIVSLFAAGQFRQAYELALNGRSPAAETLAQAIKLKMANRLDKAEIEERLQRIATARLHELQSGFRFLDIVAQLAPLMGLFGTVLGMIEAFKKLQSAGNAVDPSILAGGIWVALLTTAVGLAVAMPVSIVLSWLETRLESERVAIQTFTADILAGAAPLQEKPPHQAMAGEVQLAN